MILEIAGRFYFARKSRFIVFSFYGPEYPCGLANVTTDLLVFPYNTHMDLLVVIFR